MPRLPLMAVMSRGRGVRNALVQLDRELFDLVAGARMTGLDRVVPVLSRSANHSVLWVGVAGGLWSFGGRRGQRAALRGLVSIGATSLVVNQGVKRAVRRPRPSNRSVPAVRRVKVPLPTTSFPSGHAGSAAAFAAGVAAEWPSAGPPLALLAAAVAFSRVYVGVHYPLDVLVGASIGTGVAQLSRRAWPVLPERADATPPSADCHRAAPNQDGANLSIVVNPSSGSELGDDIVDALSARLPRARIVRLTEDDELDDVLHAAADDCDVLGIAGGDGSVAAAAAIALDRDRPLLVLPVGTLNHLARDLRADDADQAIDALIAGELVRIDVATIDGRLFINSAGFGAYPDMLVKAERLRRRLGRWPGQLTAFLWTLLDAEPLDVTIDGTRCSIWMAFVGNGRHEPAGFAPSWRPRLDDERLDVRVLLADVRWSRLRAAAAALTGHLPTSKVYVERQTRELHVATSHSRLPLSQDGDPFEGNGSFAIEKPSRRLAVYARHRPAG
jgi:diacylglycerol kinase family enzyme/membrane-associated phospholipid phosphatase